MQMESGTVVGYLLSILPQVNGRCSSTEVKFPDKNA